VNPVREAKAAARAESASAASPHQRSQGEGRMPFDEKVQRFDGMWCPLTG